MAQHAGYLAISVSADNETTTHTMRLYPVSYNEETSGVRNDMPKDMNDVTVHLHLNNRFLGTVNRAKQIVSWTLLVLQHGEKQCCLIGIL